MQITIRPNTFEDIAARGHQQDWCWELILDTDSAEVWSDVHPMHEWKNYLNSHILDLSMIMRDDKIEHIDSAEAVLAYCAAHDADEMLRKYKNHLVAWCM